MSRYIDADEFMSYYDLSDEEAREENRGEIITAYDIEQYLICFPAYDVQPVVHARWNEENNVFSCSKCGYSFEPEGYKYFFRYCPLCGAKMDGGEDIDEG